MPQPSIPATNTVPIIIPANQPVQPITCEAQIPIMPTNYVSVAQIGRVVLDTAGVSDYTDLTINDAIDNVVIPDGSVPVIGVVTLL